MSSQPSNHREDLPMDIYDKPTVNQATIDRLAAYSRLILTRLISYWQQQTHRQQETDTCNRLN
jgi:hypothetical protein